MAVIVVEDESHLHESALMASRSKSCLEKDLASTQFMSVLCETPNNLPSTGCHNLPTSLIEEFLKPAVVKKGYSRL
jgi:hypothetical protein